LIRGHYRQNDLASRSVKIFNLSEMVCWDFT